MSVVFTSLLVETLISRTSQNPPGLPIPSIFTTSFVSVVKTTCCVLLRYFLKSPSSVHQTRALLSWIHHSILMSLQFLLRTASFSFHLFMHFAPARAFHIKLPARSSHATYPASLGRLCPCFCFISDLEAIRDNRCHLNLDAADQDALTR